MSQTEAEQRLSQEIQFFDFMFTVLEIVQKLFAMTSSNKTEKQYSAFTLSKTLELLISILIWLAL